MPGLGAAALYSEKDKRFRAHINNVTVGMGMELPDALKDKKEGWERKYEFLPVDLEFSWHKY